MSPARPRLRTWQRTPTSRPALGWAVYDRCSNVEFRPCPEHWTLRRPGLQYWSDEGTPPPSRPIVQPADLRLHTALRNARPDDEPRRGAERAVGRDAARHGLWPAGGDIVAAPPGRLRARWPVPDACQDRLLDEATRRALRACCTASSRIVTSTPGAPVCCTCAALISVAGDPHLVAVRALVCSASVRRR
jgi:hypothetical protein